MAPQDDKLVEDACPFCGGEANCIMNQKEKVHPYRFVCSKCGAQTAHHGSFQGAIKAWTHRIQSQAADKARIAALEAALRTVRDVLKEGQPAITCTVWVPGQAETLLDHVEAALENNRG